MKRKMPVWVLAVAMIVSIGALSPRPAQALSTTEQILIYTAVGAGAAIVLVLVATYLTRDENTLFLTQPPRFDLERDAPRRRHFQVGTACRGPDGTVALVCW